MHRVRIQGPHRPLSGADRTRGKAAGTRFISAKASRESTENPRSHVSGESGTERKLTNHAQPVDPEQLLRMFRADKMSSLALLVSGVTHEINNPNNLIMLNVDVLESLWREAFAILDDYGRGEPGLRLGGMPYREMRSSIRELLGGMLEGAQRIRDTIANLRDYVRRDPGNLDCPVNMNGIVHSAVAVAGSFIKKSTRWFSLDLAADLPEFPGNRQQLVQAVINLLTNACQALGDREQKVTVSTAFDERAGLVLVRITDEGEGIPEENLPYLRDPLFTTRRATGGTGLGLAVVYEIVTRHGGTIEFAAARTGTGTSVTLGFPSPPLLASGEDLGGSR